MEISAYLLSAENFRIVDIETNVFIYIKISLIFSLYPGN